MTSLRKDTMRDLTETRALLEHWKKEKSALDVLVGNAFLPLDVVSNQMRPLEMAALRLIAEHAPHLRPMWDQLAIPAKQHLIPDVRVSEIRREFEGRLPILNELVTILERNCGVSFMDLNIPDAHRRYREELDDFHRDAPYDKSVFVMMKFSDDTMGKEQRECLTHIYLAIESELHRHGLTPRRADQKTYARTKQLWDNICIYMLGSKHGIAVLEDYVGKEFNPNVALEYGFMKGLGREVLLLKEQGFKHSRADIIGTISKNFQIDSPYKVSIDSIREAVAGWLTDINVHPKHGR